MTLAKAVAKVRETQWPSGQQPGVCLPSIHKTLLFITLWLEWMEHSESSNAPLLFNFSGLNGYIGTMASACLTIRGWHCLWSDRRGQYREGKHVGKGWTGLFTFYFLFFFSLCLWSKLGVGGSSVCICRKQMSIGIWNIGLDMAQTVASGSMEETNENFVNKLNLCEPPDPKN